MKNLKLIGMLGLLAIAAGVSTLRRRDRLARVGARQGHEGHLRSVSDLRPDRHGRGRRVRHLRLLQHRLDGQLGRTWPVATCTAINQSMLNVCLSAIAATDCANFDRLPLTLGKCEEATSASRPPPRGDLTAGQLERASVRSARRARPASRRRPGTTSRCRRRGPRSRRPPTAPSLRPPSRCGDRVRADGPARGRPRRRRPVTTNPSGRSSTVTPARRSSRAMATMRSDSLTRSSARSANTVSPSASAAATASAGISSIERNASSPATCVPRSRDARTRTATDGLAHRVARGGDLDVGAHRREHVQRARRGSG